MAGSFFEDRARGKEVEHLCALLLRLLTHHKQATAVPVGLYSDYDIVDERTGRTFEVKADWHSAKTDQFVVEHHFGDKPSGVAVSTADDWIFWDGRELVLISVDALIDVVREHGVRNEFRFRGPGDPVKKTVYGIGRPLIRERAIVVAPPAELVGS